MYDPKYKMKYRQPSIRRLAKYDSLPPPMVDDPPEARRGDWEERCKLVYDYLMDLKRGIIPPSQRRGLWYYAERPIVRN